MDKIEKIPRSYQLLNNRWRPRLISRTYKDIGFIEQSYEWQKQFDTEEEANIFVSTKIQEEVMA